jgi:hypothetical protein
MSKTAKTVAATAISSLMLLTAGMWWFSPRTNHEIVIAPVQGGQK